MEGFRCIARSALDIDVYVMVAKLTSLLHCRLVNVVILLLLLIIFVNSRFHLGKVRVIHPHTAKISPVLIS